MAIILAIDTATEYLSLALKTDKIDTIHLKVGNQQSEYILPELEKLLKRQDINVSELKLIVYNQGPGAFTGLRIGLSIALGLAYSTQCELMAIPAFMLYSIPTTYSYTTLIVALDARLGQIYLAGINQKDYSYCIQPQLIEPQELAAIINNNAELTPQNTIITGNGISSYQDKIDPQFLASYTYLEQSSRHAERMITLAESGYFKKCSAFTAELLYIRNKVALDINEQKIIKTPC